MDYAEASYFEGYHFQHIAAWRENARVKGIQRRHQVYHDRNAGERRSGSRIIHQK